MQGGVGRRKRRVMLEMLWRRVAKLAATFTVVLLLTALLVWLLDHEQARSNIKSYGDAVWLCIVTLSTVGYGDVAPVGVAGRAVTAAFIVFTLLSLGFLLAALNEAVLEVKRMEETGLLGTDLRDHIIVYGFSPVAQTAISQLLGADRNVALICEHIDQIAVARQLGDSRSLFITAGEVSHEMLVERVNAMHATTAVVASDDDAHNIIAALNVRAVNPDIRVIVSVRAPELRRTLISSGVTYVASPFELSGRLVASAAFEPEVAKLVEEVSNSGDDGFDLQQFSAQPFAGQSVAELRRHLEEIDGPLLLATCVSNGVDYDIRPHPRAQQVLTESDQIIVLCNTDQAGRLTSRWNLRQGR
jgi:voltage-gated potassium channel